MNAFVQSVKHGRILNLKEANHLGIAGTIEILGYAINILNDLDSKDQEEDVEEKTHKMINTQRKRVSMTSSSRRRRERMTPVSPPDSLPPTQAENSEKFVEATSVRQSEPISKVDSKVIVISPLQKTIAYFKKPKWAVCILLVTIIAFLPT